MFAFMLMGPPAAGKTSVLGALTDALSAEDVRHATVEVEALTSAHPPLDDDQCPAPVDAICGLYPRFRYDLLLATVTVESDAHVRGVLTFAELEQLVAATVRLSPVIAGLDGIVLALSTEGERSAAVAERIREAWPAELRPDAG